MDFGLSTEQEQLADAERAWLLRHDPIARVRAALDEAPITVDPAAIRHASEAGLAGLLRPEVGGTHVDLAVLTEAHGYAASSLPLADVAIAAWLLGVAHAPQSDSAAEGSTLFGVTRLGPTGTATPVPMAADMSGIVAVGGSGDGEFVAVVQDARLTNMTTLDLSRTWARPNVELTERIPLAPGTFDRVRDALAVHRALDGLGAAARLLEMTVSYVGQREQFGVPIGSFQAVKHHCADMVLRVEAARATLWAAALALDTAADTERSRAAAAAAAYAKAAASEVAGAALQVHGGIGFTWEHDLHLVLRRIKVDEAMDGTVAEHRLALVPG